MGNNLKDWVNKNSFDLHRNADGSWGTDAHDGQIIGDILRGIGGMIKDIILAKIIVKKASSV